MEDMIEQWRYWGARGHGYLIGRIYDTPRVAAESEDYNILEEDDLGNVLAERNGEYIVVCEVPVHGPRAVVVNF